MKRVQFVGLDVHADTIAVAVAEPGGTVRSVGVIPNRPESIRKLVKRLGSPEQLRACCWTMWVWEIGCITTRYNFQEASSNV